MRVRKVDSDAIKLYESSQVKFKTTGTIREVQFSAGVNKSCAIQNISKDTYLDKATGEIKERNRFIYHPVGKVRILLQSKAIEDYKLRYTFLRFRWCRYPQKEHQEIQ